VLRQVALASQMANVGSQQYLELRRQSSLCHVTTLKYRSAHSKCATR
jgi:hypothetical protein